MSTIFLLETTGTIIDFGPEMLGNLALQLVNTLIIIGILAYILYKPVKEFMQKRTDSIEGQLNDASTKQKEATELKALYEQKLKNIEVERGEILESARRRALEQESHIIEEAQKEAQVLRNRAKTDIEREKQKVKDDMRGQIVEISTLIATRYVESAINEEAQNKLLDEVISDLGDATWLN